ncbi:hypothetical protein D7241_11105 [Stutzerimonas sp. VN223-3]
MSLQIRFVSNLVFPIAALPDAFLSFARLAGALDGCGKLAGENTFEQVPATGEVGVAFGERPDGVQVSGKMQMARV